MLRLEEWVDIVSRRAAGQSIKGIARDLGISRNTVRATLRREGPPSYRRRAAPGKLDPYRGYLLARLAEFPELTAKRLHTEIAAMGYCGGISILKDFTRPYRVPRREPVVRFETPPGQQAQCDFGLARPPSDRRQRARPLPVRHGLGLLALHVRRSDHRCALADLPRLS